MLGCLDPGDASEAVPRYRLCRGAQCLGAVWFCTASSPSIPLNAPVELELNIVVAGSAVVRVGADLHSARAGDMLWIAPGQPRVTLARSPDLAMWALMFRPRLLEELGSVQRLDLGRPAERLTLPHELLSELSAKAYRLLRNQRRVQQFNCGVAALLLEAWRGGGGPASAAPPAQHPAVAAAVHVLRNATGPLALPLLARRVGLSQYQLSRTFHEQVGVPISHYAAHQAVQRFARLRVSGPSKNLLECAFAAGFGSYAQFYRTFSAVVGLRPGEHSKLLADGIIPPMRFSAAELPRESPIRDGLLA